MITSPHAAVGAVIGTLAPNPIVAVPLAIASHYLLDTVPHWQETLAPYIPNKKTYIRITIDITLAIGIVILLVRWNPSHASSIWIGAITANVPDLDSLLTLYPEVLKRGMIKKYWDWHCKIQNETSGWHGIWTQLAVVALVILIGYFASRR